MTYSEEQYNSLLVVCRSYKNDYDKAFERLKAQQREIDALKDENEKVYAVRDNLLKENDELIKTNAELLLLPKQAVKQAKIGVLNELKWKMDNERYNDDTADIIRDTIDELIKEIEK